ncbi:MAG: formate--tetrahydrofolate ligase, partial [Bacteroidia bacterium]|nr:formate--tetrahydrofolate ligase [Bacteroidia bacterium]
NLQKHIENIKLFGLQPVVALNYFPTDTDEEINIVKRLCDELNVKAVVSKAFAEGGNGAAELAKAVVEAAEKSSHFKPLYNWKESVESKIETIASQIYGADGVEYTSKAKTQLKTIKELGLEHLPVCIAKTQKSLSDNEQKIGRPTGFKVTVREFEFASGAGFIIPILGDIMRIPGLPNIPASENMMIDENGKISGLS